MSGRFVSRRSFALGSLAAAALTVMPAARTQYGAVSASAADVRLPGPHKLFQSRLVRTPGYGAATLFWPREPQARCPVVVTFPGYTGKAEEMHTIAKRLATHGCAVLAAGSIEPKAFPEYRAKQMLAALDDARGRGEWASVIDPAKTALVGYSMGGGGALTAAERENVSAVVALNPWAQRGFNKVTAPVLIVGGSNDTVAPMSEHARPIYTSMKKSRQRAMLTRIAGRHDSGIIDDPLILSRITAFIKVHAAGEAAYQPALKAQAEPLTRWQMDPAPGA